MEYIDVYDDLGQKSGKIEEKDEAHRKALIHKGVCVWIINSKNEILLQTRGSHVMFPEMLDISFSGHVRAGETSLEAAIREGREELGIEIESNKLKYLFSCREYGEVDGYCENEIDDVFLYKTDIPIEKYSFMDNEVKAVQYVPFEKFKKMIEFDFEMFLPYEMHYRLLIMVLDGRLPL